MTGTSLDALDAALIEFRGRGLSGRARWLAGARAALGGSLQDGLRQAARQQPLPVSALAALARELAQRHVRAIRRLCATHRPDLIVLHGQTIFHAPPLSWQLINAAEVARSCAAPVVYDLRAADLAAGGQGAPITPLADYVLFRTPQRPRHVLNLGGFANFTRLPAAGAHTAEALSAVTGGDVCVCNQLLDAAARRWLRCPLDRGGRAALTGVVLPRLYAQLTQRLVRQARARRALGTHDELFNLVEGRAASGRPADRLRTICAALAEALARRLRGAEEILLAGGGVHNRALLVELSARCDARLCPTEALGVPAGQREAVAMAVLGALAQDGIPITLPQVTGVRGPAPLAGAWVFPP